MAHAAVAPMARQGGPLKIPSSRFRLARGHTPPSGGLRPDSRECAYLEQAPPRSRVRTTLEQAPPRSRALRTCTLVPVRGVRAFNAMVEAGRRHHAPGTCAPVLSHQLPRKGTHPRHCGGLCDVAGARPVTPRCLLLYG
jgi:hypothetical protein